MAVRSPSDAICSSVADGPYVADSVTLTGNRVRIVGTFGTSTKSDRTFVLNEQLKRLVALKA